MEVELYEVYARHDSEPALHQVGTVEAASVRDARVFARAMYDERKWRELAVLPRRAVRTLIRPA